MPHICSQCGWVDTTARGLSQHIKDTHTRPRNERVLGARTEPEPPRSNNGPAVIAEFTAEERDWLLRTTEMQMTAGMNVLQMTHDDKIEPSRKVLDKLIADLELVRGIRKKLEG